MPVQGQNPFLTQDQWDKMYNLKRGLEVANMPLDQAIGYGIGAWLGNYLSRRNDNIASGKINNTTNTENNGEGILSGVENKGPQITDTLGNNSDYVRQVMMANADIPQNTTLDQYNKMADNNRIISAYQNMQPQTQQTTQQPMENQSMTPTATVFEQVTTTPKESSLLGESDKLKIKNDPITRYTLGYFNQPINFNNAVAPSNSEAAALSLPEYLKPKVEYYINQIQTAKQDYANAQINGDSDGMAKANTQAEMARSELNKLGINGDLFGANKTLEQVQNSMSDVDYYSPPGRQNISPYQQKVADKIISDIVEAKYAYDNATTDNERLLAQLQARNARTLAAQYGLDVSAYGSDIPAERAMLTAINETPQFNTDNATSRYASNPMSTQEYWQQLYDEAIERGAGRTAAERYATQRAAAYQAGRINDLSAQFIQYGINSDGSVDNLGMSILSQLRTEDPDAYTQLLSAYGMPRDIFATNQQIKRDNNTAQNRLIAMNKEGEINSRLQAEKAQQTIDLQTLNAQQQLALYEAKSQIDRAYQNASIADKMNIMYSWLIQNGVEPQTAGLMAAGLYSPKGNGKSSNEKKEEKPPTYISEIDNLISQMDAAVNQYAAFDGDSEEGESLRVSSGEAIDAVEDYFNKNKEKFDNKDVNRIMTRMYVANYKRAMAAYNKTNNEEYKKQADGYKPFVPENLR